MSKLAKDHESRQRRHLRRASQWIVVLFWVIQFVELTVISLAEGTNVAARSLLPRLIVFAAGILLTFGFVEVAARLTDRPFRTRLVYTILWALLFCLILVSINYLTFASAFRKQGIPFDISEYVYTAFAWSWFYLSIAGTLLAFSYQVEVRDREGRLAAMEAVAQDAKLAALRYQLNPHFLFNTLNSVASLIDRGDGPSAERMVENLADFLRATLELDPVNDITLGQEIELQQLYLAIEQERFPDRLIPTFNIPPTLRGAQVPALITQPLVENAIRHAVERSTDPVTVNISAAADSDMLTIVVEDNGVPLRPAGKGTGVGLANVRARLAGRFQTNQTLETTPRRDGFRVSMRFPLRGMSS